MSKNEQKSNTAYGAAAHEDLDGDDAMKLELIKIRIDH